MKYFSQRLGFEISGKLFPIEKIYQKCQILFPLTNKKHITNLSSAELAKRVVKVNRFLRWRPWRPSLISDRPALAIFDLQVALLLHIKLRVNWPFDSGKEAQNRYRRWQPSWISDRNDFSCVWSTSHPDASYKFQVNWHLGSREEAKNRFSRWPSWISDRDDFSYFWSSHPNASCQVSSLLAFQFRRRSKKLIFNTAAMAAILYFR